MSENSLPKSLPMSSGQIIKSEEVKISSPIEPKKEVELIKSTALNSPLTSNFQEVNNLIYAEHNTEGDVNKTLQDESTEASERITPNGLQSSPTTYNHSAVHVAYEKQSPSRKLTVIRRMQRETRTAIVETRFLDTDLPDHLIVFQLTGSIIAYTLGLAASCLFMNMTTFDPFFQNCIPLSLLVTSSALLAVCNLIQCVQYHKSNHPKLTVSAGVTTTSWTGIALVQGLVGVVNPQYTTLLGAVGTVFAAFIFCLAIYQHIGFQSFAGPFAPLAPSRHSPTVIPVLLTESTAALCFTISTAFSVCHNANYWLVVQNSLRIVSFALWTMSSWGSLCVRQVAVKNRKRRELRMQKSNARSRAIPASNASSYNVHPKNN